ncbi:hypothetical protein DL546_003978 [Coniochaeta pulveracea]|uniref:Pentatricopeptide repeat domain-containing protein n=1 Tax=Coniochaeta pulveracea TaxID=177199 RepID=A0A420YDH1_9PEZI|nr:hypothetical protein DL546_003978 [Coniochaeta pulveracea]
MRAAPRSLQQVAYYARRQLSTPHNCTNLGLENERQHSWRRAQIRWVASAGAVARKELDDVGLVDAMIERHHDHQESSEYVPAAADEQQSQIWTDSLHQGRFGKWSTIAFDHFRLLHESNVGRPTARLPARPRAVDDPRNINDIDLWACILDFRHRREGLEGVAAIMYGLQERKTLWDVQGPSAERFWTTISAEAVQDETLLMGVWGYAEWMVETHGVRWPKLYDTVLSTLISRKEAKRAGQWHIRLRVDPVTSVKEVKPRPPVITKREEKAVTESGNTMGYRQLINRIHGQTFGIKEKSYNDALGARWFASSWISLDIAIEVVRFIGWYQIGPLSLQSIALREGQPDRILDRLDQLEFLGIDIGKSSYAKALRHLATMDDHETLAELLTSDAHPDVYDDVLMQEQILKVALETGDWRQYRLILAVKVAVSLDVVSLASNQAVAESLAGSNRRVTISILEDMERRGVQLLPSTSDAISMHIINNFAPHKNYKPNTTYHVALCRLIMGSRFPLATQAVQSILYHIGNAGRIDTLEELSMEILRRYNDVHSSSRPTLNVHKLDVPEFFREEPSYGSFQLIPRELNLRHELHPVQRIFDLQFLQHIIQWSFTAPQQQPGTQDLEFTFVRGIRLLALLRDNGVVYDFKLVKKLRQSIEMHLVVLLAESSAGRRPKGVPRWIGQLDIAQAKVLCEEAWGAELLPSVDALREKVHEVTKNNQALREGGRMRTELGPSIKRVYSFRHRNPSFMRNKVPGREHSKYKSFDTPVA